MRIRATGVTLVVALILAACGSGNATPTAAPATTAPATTAPATTAPATTAPATTAPASETPSGTTWKIGVVTDVGTVDDKNFNEYSFKGATDGATSVGAAPPDVVVPADASEYAADIQSFVDQGYNLIVTVGFNLTNDTVVSAKANPDVWYVGVDQAPCIDATGAPDTTFACAGDPVTLIPNFIGLQYAEDQAGYLAGIVAASISANGKVGAIGGINLVPAVVRYLQGYELGAMSVNPAIVVNTDYVSTSDFTVAFNDPATGKTFAEQFISTNGVDVLFQVAGKTGNGVLEAACAAGIHGIGVDVDQWLSLGADTNTAYQCIVTSAEKHLASSVQQTIEGIAAGTAAPGPGGVLHFDATNDGVGVSPEADGAGLITADIQALLDAALAGMQDGSVTTCPETCGTP